MKMPEADFSASGMNWFSGGGVFASLRSAKRTKQLCRSKTRLFIPRNSGIGYHGYQRYHSYHLFKDSFIMHCALFMAGALPQFS